MTHNTLICFIFERYERTAEVDMVSEVVMYLYTRTLETHWKQSIEIALLSGLIIVNIIDEY